MKFFFDSGRPTEPSPIIHTKVLNAQECGVSAVGITWTGKLCYRLKGKGFPEKGGILSVDVIKSKVHKNRDKNYNVEADFDIHTTDGRVIEVHSCYKPIIEQALRYAPVVDIRDSRRAARRCDNVGK